MLNAPHLPILEALGEAGSHNTATAILNSANTTVFGAKHCVTNEKQRM